eukprot:Gb_36892 [translate_table: standard]
MGSLEEPIGKGDIKEEVEDLTWDSKSNIKIEPFSQNIVTSLENGLDDNSKKRKFSCLPLEVGTRILCKWRDSKLHPVKVIERRKLPYGAPNEYEYYVHYTEWWGFIICSWVLNTDYDPYMQTWSRTRHCLPCAYEMGMRRWNKIIVQGLSIGRALAQCGSFCLLQLKTTIFDKLLAVISPKTI